jgi:hypothetical protein
MPLRKFRTIEEMNAVRARSLAGQRRSTACRPDPISCFAMGALAPPVNFPKGVHKFRSIEEMNAFKQRYEDERIARTKAERVVKK